MNGTGVSWKVKLGSRYLRGARVSYDIQSRRVNGKPHMIVVQA